MLCPKCGSSNPEGAKFCGKCGEPFVAQQTAAATPLYQGGVRQHYPQAMPQQNYQQPAPEPAYQAAPQQNYQQPMPQQTYQPVAPQAAPTRSYAGAPLGGGAVVSQPGIAGNGGIIAGVVNIVLILLVTFTPWIEITLGFMGNYQIAIPSLVMQLIDKGSDLYQMLLGSGAISNSDMESALLMLTIILIVLWVAPCALLAFDAFRAFTGKQPTGVGGVFVSVSAVIVLIALMAVVNYLNGEAGGYTDFGQFVHASIWLWISLVCGIGGALMNKTLTK